MTTKEEVQGSWNQLVGAVKSKYSQISGDDLAGIQGNVQQLAGMIQRKTGKAREEIDEFLRTAGTTTANTVGMLSDAANDMASKASETIREGYDYARDASRDSYRAATQTVQQRPAESLLAALGIGVVVGMIVGASLFGRR